MKKNKLVNYFTLIELLVVVAVIAILASLLLPSLNQARDRAKTITCSANLKQQGTAIGMYENDYSDWLPVWGPYGWKYQIAPYLVGYKVYNLNGVQSNLSLCLGNLQKNTVWSTGSFLCPSFRDPSNGDQTVNNYLRGGYGWNYNWAGMTEGDSTRPRKRAAQMKKPSVTILSGDAESADVSPMVATYRWEQLFWPGIEDLRGLRHQKGINMAWGDLHVGRITRADTLNNGKISGINYYYWVFDK